MISAGFGPYPEAVSFFRKKLSIPTDRWTDLYKEHHAHGFMVAGVSRLSLLDDIRQQVDLAIEGKIDFQEFKQRFTETAWKAGWSAEPGTRAGDVPGGNAFDDPDWRVRQRARQIAARRARVIYETNTRQAYNAGRWRQLTDPDAVQLRPYIRYRHSDKSRVPRAQHKAWDGLILHWTDPWLRTHAPMNGWGCNCWLEGLSLRDLRRLGKDGPDQAPAVETYVWLNPRTGQNENVPVGIDPGFDYNVGAASMAERAAQAFGDRVMQLPPAWRDAALGDMRRRAVDWLADPLPAWLRQLRERGTAVGDRVSVGFLPAAAVRTGTSPLVVLPDAVALASVVDQLPALVGRAELLFRDRATGDVIVARLQTRGASAAEDLFDTARIRPGTPSQVVSTASVSRAGLANFDPIGSTR